MFNRVNVLETCVTYLATYWCRDGRVPVDPIEREAFVQRIVANYIKPLRAHHEWTDEQRYQWEKEKQWVGEQMAVAAARAAHDQQGQLTN
jgi:hypothetical protein